MLTQPEEVTRLRLVVQGVVQGVGFRPFVSRLAHDLSLAGHVYNSSEGVSIEIEGPRDNVGAFVRRLRETPPPSAEIDAVRLSSIPVHGDVSFKVRRNCSDQSLTTRAPPDMAICDDCLEEIRDPSNRRYGYPFTNCTNCGPRYSIIETMPYDRAATTMRDFDLCARCAEEYSSPHDRRFHAEPIACSHCGPEIALLDKERVCLARGGEALDHAARFLREGACVAVKGVGGFHLLANACDEAAIRALREKKKRPAKPFAILAGLDEAHALAHVSQAEERLLASAAAPIVLVTPKADARFAANLAPNAPEIGIFLPYTPLHRLLSDRAQCPFAATSANGSGEPIIFDETRSYDALSELADFVLFHNRRIRRPIDDAVMRVIDGAPQVLRLGRGLAPGEIKLGGASEASAILALGGHLKTAPVIVTGERAILGPHVGDLGSLAMDDAFHASIEGLQDLNGVKPEIIACDQHPDYETTRFADDLGLPVIPVQHHHAHILSVMAEHGLEPPVLGVAWDGAGLGPDGTIWGGEFLHIEDGSWTRIARLVPFRLPGGEKAMREPRRSALGALMAMNADVNRMAPAFNEKEFSLLQQMVKQGLHSPATSSAGRLFDVCSALLGLCLNASHEGEAAMTLERCARLAREGDCRPYPFDTVKSGAPGLLDIDWRPMLDAMIGDLEARRPAPAIARAIHETFAAMIAGAATIAGIRTVALSGGCFQNRLLTECALRRLRAQGFQVFINRAVPPGDGGLALGQALWARGQALESAACV
ncbi:carbamoyltransferase HypF [Marinicaulis flavus]|uniref:Carbamoyltransferase HypF n=1 Tax=Hyphococcus luteus TaxID=2058213 RepID=A0A2S7K285_9PROT|nr:carbamoyltransferase HypF [Marinicaulis flavus]